MEKYIDNKKIKIYLNEELTKGSSKAILVVHGFFEHSGRYDEFISRLKDIGFNVFAMDLRGHGKTISKKGDLKSIKKLIEDVDVVVKYIKNNYHFDKFGLFGHSTGGLISSIYASKYDNELDFLVLTSPAVYCPSKYRKIKYIPYKIVPFFYLKRDLSEITAIDEYTLKSFSIRSIGVIFDEGVRCLNKVLNIKCPTLLMCGKRDDLLDEPDKYIAFSDKLTCDKKFIMYEEAGHRIVHNDGYETRVKDIEEWLNSNF